MHTSLYNTGNPARHSVMIQRSGLGVGAKEAKEGRDIHIYTHTLMADLSHCMAETNTKL